MGSRIKNINVELDTPSKQIKAYDVIFSNLNTDYMSWQDIEDTNSVELYKYIIELRNTFFECHRCLKSEHNATKTLLTGWNTLTETMKKDPGLQEDWDRILITMKLLE